MSSVVGGERVYAKGSLWCLRGGGARGGGAEEEERDDPNFIDECPARRGSGEWSAPKKFILVCSRRIRHILPLGASDPVPAL